MSRITPVSDFDGPDRRESVSEQLVSEVAKSVDLSTVRMIVTGIVAATVFVMTTLAMQDQVRDLRAELADMRSTLARKANTEDVNTLGTELDDRVTKANNRAEANRARITDPGGVSERITRLEERVQR